jgi:myo-inositol-1(or 4)-monophosphatase
VGRIETMGAETIDLKDIHDFLIELASKAGEIITNALPNTGSTGSKKNSEFPVCAKLGLRYSPLP